MITVGCCGFAVPATRYFKEYGFVEVQETQRAVPGPGTIRRWRREAPEGFEFALLGPREIAHEGFSNSKTVAASLQMLDNVKAELSARRAIFSAGAEFAPSPENGAALKAFLERVSESFDSVVFDLGSAWDPEKADAIAEDTGTIAARDPLVQGLSSRPVAYYRLPGPAGHKSRYEDPAISRLAGTAQGAPEQEAHYVFTNVDMFADGRRFKRALAL